MPTWTWVTLGFRVWENCEIWWYTWGFFSNGWSNHFSTKGMVNAEHFLIGCFQVLRRFSGISAISRLGSRRLQISEILAARQGIEPQTYSSASQELTTTLPLLLKQQKKRPCMTDSTGSQPKFPYIYSTQHLFKLSLFSCICLHLSVRSCPKTNIPRNASDYSKFKAWKTDGQTYRRRTKRSVCGTSGPRGFQKVALCNTAMNSCSVFWMNLQSVRYCP